MHCNEKDSDEMSDNDAEVSDLMTPRHDHGRTASKPSGFFFDDSVQDSDSLQNGGGGVMVQDCDEDSNLSSSMLGGGGSGGQAASPNGSGMSINLYTDFLRLRNLELPTK